MKIIIISSLILAVCFALFQIYIVMSSKKTETQAYKLIRAEEKFEIRYYPTAMLAKVYSNSKSYGDLGSSGFRKLANYIFGGNSEKEQMAMTTPVHMDIGDKSSTMAFVLPAAYNEANFPKPNSGEVFISASKPEYVAVIQFGGFASDKKIQTQKSLLEQLLKEKGISYYGNFRFLGYNPPFQFFGRKNEVIVAVQSDEFVEMNK